MTSAYLRQRAWPALKLVAALWLLGLGSAGCASPGRAVRHQGLFPPLSSYVNEVRGELHVIPEARKVLLEEIAGTVAACLGKGQPAKLTFICTHNSRRSHMSQIWAQTAAYYYGLDHAVSFFSGGTQVTACNCRTVTAMRRVGFSIEDITRGENPRYRVRYASDGKEIIAYSKLYHADANPKRGFIALMTCSVADKTCPAVTGAIGRYAIHYADPRKCDDTPVETAAYNERCREIAREMFYLLAEVRRRVDNAKAPQHRCTGRYGWAKRK